MAGKPRSRARCRARTKTTGQPCRRPTYNGSHRCVMHCGPHTVEGKKRSLEALAIGRSTVIKNRLARQSPHGVQQQGYPPNVNGRKGM